MKSDKVWQEYKQLPSEQQLEIIKEILSKDSGFTGVFNVNCNGNTNSIHNSIVIQVSSSQEEKAEEILKKIQNISGETIEKILIAIAERIQTQANKSQEKK